MTHILIWYIANQANAVATGSAEFNTKDAAESAGKYLAREIGSGEWFHWYVVPKS